jgi:hypothetical protein
MYKLMLKKCPNLIFSRYSSQPVSFSLPCLCHLPALPRGPRWGTRTCVRGPSDPRGGRNTWKPPKAWEWPGISKKAGRLASKPVTEKWWKEGPVTRHKTHKADLFGASQIPVVGWIFDQKGEMGHGNDLCSQAAWCSFPFMFVLRCFDNLPSHSQIWQWKAHQACPFIEDLPIKPWFFPNCQNWLQDNNN